MDAGADGPLQEFGRAEGLGKLLWAPPEDLTRRTEKSAEKRVMQGMVVFVAGIGFLALGAVLLGPGRETNATGVMVFGVFLLVAGFWVARSAGIAGSALVGVFERGLLLPSSFESGPDLTTLGGPTVIRREYVDHIQEIERGGERALLVWSSAGPGGVLTRQLEGANLSPEEGEVMMAGFVKALMAAGFAAEATLDESPAAPGESPGPAPSQ